MKTTQNLIPTVTAQEQNFPGQYFTTKRYDYYKSSVGEIFQIDKYAEQEIVKQVKLMPEKAELVIGNSHIVNCRDGNVPKINFVNYWMNHAHKYLLK